MRVKQKAALVDVKIMFTFCIINCVVLKIFILVCFINGLFPSPSEIFFIMSYSPGRIRGNLVAFLLAAKVTRHFLPPSHTPHKALKAQKAV